MKNLIKTNLKKGFSLVELLVVIAVIGVIAAIAIPAMSGIFEKSDGAKNKRNAQSVASLWSSLRAAGATIASPSEATIVAGLQTGVTPSTGAFAGSTFKSNLATDEVSKTVAALTYDATSGSLTVNQ